MVRELFLYLCIHPEKIASIAKLKWQTPPAIVGSQMKDTGVHWVYINMMQEKQTTAVVQIQACNMNLWLFSTTSRSRKTATELFVVNMAVMLQTCPSKT